MGHQCPLSVKLLIEYTDECKNNPENSSTTKADEHIPSGFSMPTILSFKSIENKHDVVWGKDCMKKFCESLMEHAMEIINLKKRKMNLLTKEQQESYENTTFCHICREKFEDKYAQNKNYHKSTDHYHYTGEYRSDAHSIWG